MKSPYYLIVALIVALSLPEKSIGQTTQDLLVGTWTFNYDASFSKMEAVVKPRFDTMPQIQRARVEGNYRGRKVSFNRDGSYNQTLADGRQVTGTWSLSNNDQTLTIISVNRKSNIQHIATLSTNQLVLKPTGNEQRKLFIPESHYTKN